MIKAEFKSYGSYTTDSVSQWDLNQKLTISGLDIDVAPVLAFSCFGMYESIIVQSKLSDGVITCDVPNAILQFGKNLNVDLCSETGGQYKAFEKMIIPVNRRKKPSDYLFTDNVPLSTAESIKADLEKEINSNKTYTDKVKAELKNDNKTLNERIDTILTGTANTTKLVTVHSATIRNNSASDLTFKISSKDNETLKSIKDKSPTVINANVIAKALDGVAINGKGIPSSYNVESTNDEYVITVYSGSSSVVGQYVFMAVVTIAYEDIATDISSAELKDIRTGANGTTYPTAGDAVREQINDLKKELDDSNLDENVSQIQKNMTDISQLKESIKNATVTDGSITTPKIADKAVTGDKIDFIDKKEFHFYTPTGDANAENESANNRNYMIPFEVGTPYIYMIMQTRLQGRQFGTVNAPYKSGINNWSIYGYDVSRAIGTVKDKTVQLWSYPEKASSSNYPWTECRKFDCTELNQYFEKSQLSGTQTIYCEVHKESCGWFGVDNDTWANKDKLSILWLKEEPTLNDWLNGFETVETLNKNVEANFLKMRDALGMYHNVLDYGITPDADDNSLKFQQMVDELSQNGGGTIYVPIGTYKFDTSNGQYIEGTGGCKCCIKAKSNVSIVGESLTDSVFKMTGHSSQGVCMFGYNSATNKTPIEGCTYRNFTINGEECTIDTYSSDGKAFFYQYVKNCVWRDLRLIGTPATSLGIDFLDNVVIDSIYCYESGRIHADNSPGGAGVGIGTGAWENENFIVRNCICDNCGHFGIFLEDQHIFGDAAHRTPTYPKGAIIANNICRNGRNYGFGVRGGQHVIFEGNEAYENANGGFFSDYENKSIVIQNNLIRDNTGNGICLGNEKPGILETSFENVTIKDNVVIGNKTGINIGQKTTNLNLIDNIVRDNTVKDITVTATQTSCYVSGNLVLTADVRNYLSKVENSEL